MLLHSPCVQKRLVQINRGMLVMQIIYQINVNYRVESHNQPKPYPVQHFFPSCRLCRAASDRVEASNKQHNQATSSPSDMLTTSACCHWMTLT